jgi:hypothetical protein
MHEGPLFLKSTAPHRPPLLLLSSQSESMHLPMQPALLAFAFAAIASASSAAPDGVADPLHRREPEILQRRALSDLLDDLQAGVSVEDITQVRARAVPLRQTDASSRF